MFPTMLEGEDIADSGPTIISDFRKELWVLGLVLGWVVAVVVLWQGALMFKPAWTVSQGRGVQGVLVIEAAYCGKQCSYYGTFTSSDSRQKYSGVHLLHGGNYVGEHVPAVYLANGSQPPREVHAQKSNALIASVFLLGVGALAALACSGILVEAGLRSWRRHRSESALLKGWEREARD